MNLLLWILKRRNGIMSTLQRIALGLVIVGAINWGLIGFFNFDLVGSIFGGQDAVMSRMIYAIVGLSGLVSLSTLFKPMDEVEDLDIAERRRDLNFSSEFGKEADFSKERKTAKEKIDSTKNEDS